MGTCKLAHHLGVVAVLAMFSIVSFNYSADAESDVSEQTPTLSNSTLSIQFDSQTGGVASLVDVATGIELRSTLHAPATILHLEVVGPDGDAGLLSNLDVQNVRWSNPEPRVVELVLENLDETGISAVCRVQIEPDKPSLRWTLVLRNEGEYRLRSVSYPVLSGIDQIGATPTNDWLVHPMGEGILIPNPASNLPQFRPWWHGMVYPGDLSMQFMALYDDDVGLYIMTEDTAGHPKRFDAYWTPIGGIAALQLGVTTLVLEEPWQEYTHPFETVTQLFRGDWYTAAEEYRNWAEEQPWCSTPFLSRTALPAWYREGYPVFETINWFWDEVVPDTQVNPLLTLPELVNAYSQALETPLTLMLWGWEQHGMWDNPCSMPPRDGMRAFTEMIRALQEAAQRVGIVRSLTKWSSTSPGFEIQGALGTVSASDGEFFCGGEGDNSRCLMCPASSLWQEIMQENAVETAESGIDWLQLDEVPLGGYPFGCFNADHEHPLGYGVWWTRYLYDLVETSYVTCKSIKPAMVITTEGPSEFFLPVTDGYVSRLAIGEADFATWLIAAIPEVQFVPVFPFIYHEYIRAYRGFFPTLESYFTEYGLIADARSLIFGQIPSWSVWDALPDEISETRLNSARRHAAAFSGWAAPFVRDGRMLRPLSYEVPSVQVHVPESDTLSDYRFDLPAVLHSAWQALDGRVGYLFENISTSIQRLELDVPHPESERSSSTLRLFREGIEVETMQRSLPHSLELNISAGEIVLLIVEGNS